MKHATSLELFEYWNRLRGAAPAPRRSDIEPSDIRKILADTFILEVVDRESYVIRLAGTRMCALYGREVKGGGFLDLWTPEDRQAVATLCTAVSVDGAGAVVSAELHSAADRSVAAEILLLPLRHGATGYDRILGSCAAMERPYWVGGEAIIRQRIASLRLIWPDDRPRFGRRASDRPLLSKTPAPVLPFPVNPKQRRAHLVVLDGGKR